ncbi:hypothetical protein ACFU8R_28695 [Pseudonocardia alni]|uniref:hypothetical protein n=1 Tax=Pseudonocardia alni TaxID=33907 RepID=UPI0033200B8D
MTTIRRTTVLLAVALTAGCTTATPPDATPVPDLTTPSQAAEQAYQRYWEVTEAAFATPRLRDWTTELETVASGQALDSAISDFRTYRDFPAHMEGTVSRAPRVESAGVGGAEIVDCLDLGDSLLIADDTGEVLDDLGNQVRRYTLRASLVANGTGWRVDRLEPALDEPC